MEAVLELCIIQPTEAMILCIAKVKLEFLVSIDSTHHALDAKCTAHVALLAAKALTSWWTGDPARRSESPPATHQSLNSAYPAGSHLCFNLHQCNPELKHTSCIAKVKTALKNL